MKTYVGTDGKLHFVNSAGADSVLPFSSEEIPDMAITISCSGNLHNTTGYLWSYTEATVTIYIIDGVPESTSLTATSGCTWVQNTGYQSGTNTSIFRLKKVALIDKDKNETKVIYVA